MKIRLRPFFVPAVVIACIALLVVLACQAPSETALRVMEYAGEKGVSYAEYPSSLIKLLERNPETEAFVLNYPFRQEKTVDLGKYNLSRGVPLFVQWDEQWGYLDYGGELVGVTGSGPMCLAMAGYYVSDGEDRFSPDKIAEFAAENGYYSKGKEAGANLFSQGGPALGLKVTALPLVEKKIADYLKNGDPIIASMGSGDFDNYIVLTGYSDGMISVNDPDSRVNSEMKWPYAELAGQIKKLWVIQRAI
ncbi:MAG: C39 family peptidase [Oscillospiraceae bacterium]|nr:C39 family peptidase [Oscillospiraceae bacterium]